MRDNAARIYQEVVQLGIEKIRFFVSEQQEENLFIDFKEKKNPTQSGVSSDDKRVYAKALSGFSNASGGVIVWGVEGRKKGNDLPDVATALKPIKHLKKFLTDLNSLVSDAIVPLNTGIVNTPIFLSELEDEGFIVTFVPESEKPPHRAMCSDNKYYTRAGDSFILMEHYMLEDSFGRRQKPKLEIDYKLNKAYKIGDNQHFTITFGIRNIGKYIAFYPSIIVNSIDLQTSGDSPPYNLNIVSRGKSRIQYSGGSNDVIHPGTVIMVHHLNIAQNSDWVTKAGLLRKSDTNTMLSFTYELYAQGCQSERGTVEISPDKIMEFLGYNSFLKK